ncbi:hypothetical protein Trydic_g20854 [Trypoxylus dichotomus]
MQKIVHVENKCIESNINCLRNRLQITNADVIYFELSCWSFLAELDEGQEVNLGNVLDDTIFKIKGENSEDISEGEGELFLGSFDRVCYVDNEQMATIEKPVMRRTGDIVTIKNNKIIYKGRCDDTIKRFGNRVNLLYIENAIQIHAGLKSVCIWLEKKHKLILYVVINETNEEIASKIKDKLRIKILHALPKECMPDCIDLLPSLPLTKNGKVDKGSLASKAETLFLEKKDANRCLVDIFTSLWHNYFGDKCDLMTKTFYELGGTSIMRIQFTEEIKHDLQNRNKRTLMGEDTHTNKMNKFSDKVELDICWVYDLQACVDCTPVVLEKRRLVAVGSFSNIFIIACIDTGQEIVKVVLPNAIESSCLVSPCENYVYIGCFDHNLYCIEVSTGKIMWLYTTGDRIKNTPVFINKDTIIFGSYDKNLHCVDCKTGTKLWKVQVDAPIAADILLIEEYIMVITIKGFCWYLTIFGKVIWQLELKSATLASPTQLENGIIVPDVLGTIHYLSFSGEEVWNFNVGENIYSSILAFKNYLIFGTHNSTIYCFEELANDAMKPLLKHRISVDSATSSTARTLTHNNCIYIVVTCIVGYVYLISADDFSVAARIKLKGCRDNNLICIKIRG